MSIAMDYVSIHKNRFLMLDTVVFVYEVEFYHNAHWLLDTLDLSLLSNGVDFAHGPMKS
jgi:hypothetical protein